MPSDRERSVWRAGNRCGRGGRARRARSQRVRTVGTVDETSLKRGAAAEELRTGDPVRNEEAVALCRIPYGNQRVILRLFTGALGGYILSAAAQEVLAMPTKDVITTIRKVTVNFAPETYDTLAGIAKERKVSMSEALRQAIGLMAFMLDSMKDGKIKIERNGESSELKLL